MNQQQREVMQQALDAMSQAHIVGGQGGIDDAATALRQALATPDATLIGEGDKPAAPASEPLTDAQAIALILKHAIPGKTKK